MLSFIDWHHDVYQTEVIRRRGPWGKPEAVQFAMLEPVHWLSHQRLLEQVANIPPTELEPYYCPPINELAMVL
jgi:putative transposase